MRFVISDIDPTKIEMVPVEQNGKLSVISYLLEILNVRVVVTRLKSLLNRLKKLIILKIIDHGV